MMTQRLTSLIVVVANDNDKDKLFTFTCTSDYVVITNTLDVPKSRLGTCMDSGASRHYCPDQSKFTDYKSVEQKITTADGRMLTTASIRNLHIDLPNELERTKTVLRRAVHSPDMAFMLISISQLDKAGFLVSFNKGMCTIKDQSAKTIATIPNSDGLYKIAATKQAEEGQSANLVTGKMSISEAHRQLKTCHHKRFLKWYNP